MLGLERGGATDRDKEVASELDFVLASEDESLGLALREPSW